MFLCEFLCLSNLRSYGLAKISEEKFKKKFNKKSTFWQSFWDEIFYVSNRYMWSKFQLNRIKITNSRIQVRFSTLSPHRWWQWTWIFKLSHSPSFWKVIYKLVKFQFDRIKISYILFNPRGCNSLAWNFRRALLQVKLWYPRDLKISLQFWAMHLNLYVTVLHLKKFIDDKDVFYVLSMGHFPNTNSWTYVKKLFTIQLLPSYGLLSTTTFFELNKRISHFDIHQSF